MNKIKPWWHFIDRQSVAFKDATLASSWAGQGISFQCLEYGLTYAKTYKEGKWNIKDKEGKELYLDLCSKLEALGGKKFYADISERLFGVQYIWHQAYLSIEMYLETNTGNVSFLSSDPELTEALKKIQEEHLRKDITPEGKVFAIVPTQGGLTTESIGVAASPLERGNYTQETLHGYDKVVKDLQSSNPIGRLAIFDGPPGTGKTYLMRALLNDMPDFKFLILPSNMLSDMTGPQLLSTLIDEARNQQEAVREWTKISTGGTPNGEYTTYKSQPPSSPKKEELVTIRPLILVIEDADSCLSSRASDNISAISSILNLSDGIIGNLLDLRIVATTNAEVENIDSAIMRRGRLSARVEVGMLGEEAAQAVYERIGGKGSFNMEDKKYVPLSNIYASFKDTETNEVVPTKAKRKVGFQA